MDEDRFKFPYYFKTIFALFHITLVSPYRYTEGKKSRCVHILLILQKGICALFHLLTVLYIIVHASSTPFINLKREPIEIFSIAGHVALWLASGSVIHFLWFKQSTLEDIVMEVPEDTQKKRLVQISILIGFLVAPVGLTFFWLTDAAVKLSKLPTQILDSNVFYPVLERMFFKPALNSTSKIVTLKYWERFQACFLVAVGRFNYILASVLIWTTLVSGLALYEINCKMIHLVTVKNANILHNKVFREIVPKLQYLTGPLITAEVFACYINLSTEIVLIGEYEWVGRSQVLIKLFIVLIVLLVNAAASAKGRQLAKKMLLQDTRFYLVQEVPDKGVVLLTKSNCPYWSSEVPSIVNLSSVSIQGLIGTVTYGSLGIAFWIGVQYAIILLQFLEQQMGKLAESIRDY